MIKIWSLFFFLALSIPLAVAADRYAGAGGVDYFTMPNEESALQGTMPAGQPLTTLSTRGQWIYVASADESQVGWVLKSETSTNKPEPRKVKTNTQRFDSVEEPIKSSKASEDADDGDGILMGFVLFLFGLGLLSADSMGARLFGVLLMFAGVGSCVG